MKRFRRLQQIKSGLTRVVAMVAVLTIVFATAPLAVAQEDPTPDFEQKIQQDDLKAYIGNTPWYNPNEGLCTTGGVVGGELEGHKLPATTGGAGNEEPIDEQGRVPSTGKGVTFAKFASLGQEYRDFYITMRWRYVTWNWNGGSSGGPEDKSWYEAKPRLVLVSNPSTGKSIVAAILESGPAPWTGTPGGESDSQQRQLWESASGGDGYVDGTPEGYLGRVAGFPPAAQDALQLQQWEYGGPDQGGSRGRGHKLVYAWAPDQTAKPGIPTGANAAAAQVTAPPVEGGEGVTAGGCGGNTSTDISLGDIDTGPQEGIKRDPVTGCSGKEQVGTRRLADFAMKTWGARDYGVYNCRTVAGSSSLSLHAEGRAFDAGFEVSRASEKANGDKMFAWSIQNAAGIGTQELIWNRKIWTPSRGLYNYSGSNPHTDHVHIGQNWAGARAQTSLYQTGVL